MLLRIPLPGGEFDERWVPKSQLKERVGFGTSKWPIEIWVSTWWIRKESLPTNPVVLGERTGDE